MATAREAFLIRAASRSTAIGTVEVGTELDEEGEKSGSLPDERVDQCIEAGIVRQNDCVGDWVGDWVLLIKWCHEAEQKRKGNGERQKEERESRGKQGVWRLGWFEKWAGPAAHRTREQWE